MGQFHEQIQTGAYEVLRTSYLSGATTRRARGAYVVLGGLHVTSLPEEATLHADTIFLGPGEDTWPASRSCTPARQS
jgi:radical SAM superfamily enzyme YgiQ (UPF0313 family)